jgi:plasmid replication initiation protein
MKHQQLTVCKANKVIEAGYMLSLNEQRVVLACIGQVNSTKELLKTDEFELSAHDFAQLFSVSEDRAYHALLEVTKTLFDRYITIDNPYPDRPKIKQLKMRWISSIEYMPDEGKISLCFSQKILPYLSELKESFTKYKLEYIGKMTCIYAIRLYELLVQWQGIGKREVEVDWLKRHFQLSEGYERMFDLKKRVLEPAINDINQHSNLQVAWTQRKTGRRVTHLTFIFGDKGAAKAEKNKSKAKPREKLIFGLKQSEIEKGARPGESWEQAATRIKRTKKEAKQQQAG